MNLRAAQEALEKANEDLKLAKEALRKQMQELNVLENY